MVAVPVCLPRWAGCRALWVLVLSLWLQSVGLVPQVAAQGVELTQLTTERTDEGLMLQFSTRFDLPKSVEDSLMKGLPIYFVAEAQLLRNRWYWRDAKISNNSRTWRLTWQPLTRQYRVSTGGLNQSYASLSDALASLRGVSSWRLAEPRDIDDDGRYYLEFSYRLDTSQLPRPMQIGLGLQQGWVLQFERRWTLPPDFGLRIP